MEIVVGIDGSEASHRAFEVGLHEARVRRELLRVVHSWHLSAYLVLPPGFGYTVGPLDAEDRTIMAKHYVEELLATVPHDDVRIETDIRAGDAGQVLVEASKGADLLVLGSRRHGTLASVVIGSATNYVLHHAQCPVLIVPAGSPAEWKRIVVGVDGSDWGDAALRWGAALARTHGCPLVVVHAWQLATSPDWFGGLQPDGERYASQVEAWLREHVAHVLPDQTGLSVQLSAVQDYAAAGLTSAAGPDDLLVVGSRGRGGFTDLVMGSVAAQCAHHARGAVAVLRRGTAL